MPDNLPFQNLYAWSSNYYLDADDNTKPLVLYTIFQAPDHLDKTYNADGTEWNGRYQYLDGEVYVTETLSCNLVDYSFPHYEELNVGNPDVEDTLYLERDIEKDIIVSVDGYIPLVSDVYLTKDTYKPLGYFLQPEYNSINLHNIPYSNNDMSNAFYDDSWNTFDYLTSVSNINQNVTNMSYTFCECRRLTNAPTIPNSVVNMYHTFDRCTNLTGNIYIHSNQVTNARYCFDETSSIKNVYIPFYYTNNEYTKTYNSFIAAGYDTDGTKEGVYLKDINTI